MLDIYDPILNDLNSFYRWRRKRLMAQQLNWNK